MEGTAYISTTTDGRVSMYVDPKDHDCGPVTCYLSAEAAKNLAAELIAAADELHK